MDPMILGETAYVPTLQALLGFWMPEGGNDGVGGIEVLYVSASNKFTVHLDTKKSDEADSAATSIGAVGISSTTPQLYDFKVANAKDLVRYRLQNSEDPEYIHFQLSQPLWSPN
jgi:hypothetical protein